MNQYKDLVTVIVPVFNVEKYIHKCINSIINQTYKNLEIILVDDGSTDNSGKICDEYAKKDNRIKIVVQKNQGLSVARNNGIKNATGKLLSFVDSDDFIDVNMIERMVRRIIDFDAQMVVCGMYRYYSDNKKIGVHLEKDQILSKEEALRSILTEDVIGNYSCNKLMVKSLFDKIEYPIGKIYEDISTIYKVIAKCDRICVIPDILYFYRQRACSLAHDFSAKSFCDELDAVSLQINEIAHSFPNLKQLCDDKMLKTVVRLFAAGAARKTLNENSIMKLQDEFKNISKKRLSILSTREKLRYFSFKYFPCVYIFFRRFAFLLKRKFLYILFKRNTISKFSDNEQL